MAEVDLLILKDFSNLSIKERKRAFYDKLAKTNLVSGIKVDPSLITKGLYGQELLDIYNELFVSPDFIVRDIDWINLKANVEWIKSSFPTENFYLCMASLVDEKNGDQDSIIRELLGFYLSPKLNNDYEFKYVGKYPLSGKYLPMDEELYA